jgi:hypothetical protein
MAAPTFLQVLTAEVARMQAAHPEREGELARAHALILHGMVLPSADDPATGSVLSSDNARRYSVNGSCTCQAGQHGKGCKHLQAWKLYQYIARKVEAQEPQEAPSASQASGERRLAPRTRLRACQRPQRVSIVTSPSRGGRCSSPSAIPTKPGS